MLARAVCQSASKLTACGTEEPLETPIAVDIWTLDRDVAASASEWTNHHSLAFAATEKSRISGALAGDLLVFRAIGRSAEGRRGAGDISPLLSGMGRSDYCNYLIA